MKAKIRPQKISDEEIRNLVIERLKAFPSGKKLSIGSQGEFTKRDLIEHVKKEDQVGKKIIEAQLVFLQSLKEGTILADD